MDRNYKKSDKQIATFETFIRCASTTRKDDGSAKLNEAQYHTLKSCFGYLLSRYKKRTEAICIVFCDEVISDNPEGGSGKSMQ
ncbi:MAG: hypothetical protein ABFD00_00815 [Chloroherpetonaceae bacterium]